MAKRSLNSTLQYRILTWILFPGVFIHCLFTAVKHRHLPYLYQRLGIYSLKNIPANLIWCHCASVGEFNTALPLLRKLISNNHHLIISTNTITGKQVFKDANLHRAHHAFLPLDYKWFANRFIKKFTPKYCLVFETEFWPNILLTTLNHNIPISIVNGRISNKTLHAPNFLKRNYQKILSNITQVLASNNENASRFIALGADKNRVRVYENLKFANLIPSDIINDSRPISHPYLLCASTHEGEEKVLLEKWRNSNTLGLVIAIRHPHRANDVCNIIKSYGHTYKRHSQQPEDVSPSDIYVIDTIGDLFPFLQHAEIVFMGGSLVPVGGHNILEPAQFGKCIITGPHFHSFTDIVQDLLACNGILVAQNAEQLFQEVEDLVINKQRKITIGTNSKKFFDSKVNVLDEYSNAILEMLNQS